ncbi:MAG: hypothetical protein JOZ75_09330, partial [Candidatus Dormibacteraeota bacterium]|nr:hypothetical protein [Candidatus Dormibacteraeota bacterium]
MVTPRVSLFAIDDLDSFDDEGLRTFLAPARGGVRPQDLGRALVGSDRSLVRRVRRSLPPAAAGEFLAAHNVQPDGDGVARARRRVLEKLFWPLVYWLRPDDYEELVRGEEISPRLLAALDI